ncbi:MAG: LacI family transcriptional regulator [Candidatus Accumulibacter meliphilus]|jgi:hypothetical protein|uniref:LacI family transcriptional regulator n=1 Tax=Candidatus Accumulibacter meliphilus TaxID=2211374 RepID=A0A369XPX7_9PROT|nr:MAG: LacI family transcriptional regulator [Candidatus Accumulibacter meliphilus]
MNGIRICRTGASDVIAASDGRLTLSVPIQIKHRSGRKLVTLPNGEAAQPRPWDVAATPMQLALARGHHWLAMLESGEAKSITELAAREKIDNSYMCRMLNLTTLAPDIIAAILDESLPHQVGVHDLAISPPVLWEEQRKRIGVVGENLQAE